MFVELTDCGDRQRPGTDTPRPKTTRDPSVTGDYEFECPSPGGAFPNPDKCITELYTYATYLERQLDIHSYMIF